ncbi:13506_t:CDS:1, partial [Gigaspora margarita]
MPPRNSGGKPQCPKCGRHFTDLDGHVRRIHKTTLSNLLQKSQQ